MIIDLSEWTEYVSEDYGAPPFETELEYMVMMDSDMMRIKDEFGVPKWVPTTGSYNTRTFWRVKK